MEQRGQGVGLCHCIDAQTEARLTELSWVLGADTPEEALRTGGSITGSGTMLSTDESLETW